MALGSVHARVVIIDTGTANTGSVINMLRQLGVEPVVSANRGELETAERLLLPGVGAFDVGMRGLADGGLVETLKERVEAGVPLLGVCLGMQLLFYGSEEGSSPGLGLIPGMVRRLPVISKVGPVRVPHMGWSRLERRTDHPLLEGLEDEARFYFVHSYAAVPLHEDHVVSVSVHGNPFVSVVARGNVAGVQFHPEKSHRFGKALLSNYLSNF
tara:strand:- start:51 stop:689 length:639 start_codon:yes stop_codon:yes gene_type:complete